MELQNHSLALQRGKRVHNYEIHFLAASGSTIGVKHYEGSMNRTGMKWQDGRLHAFWTFISFEPFID